MSIFSILMMGIISLFRVDSANHGGQHPIPWALQTDKSFLIRHCPCVCTAGHAIGRQLPSTGILM